MKQKKGRFIFQNRPQLAERMVSCLLSNISYRLFLKPHKNWALKRSDIKSFYFNNFSRNVDIQQDFVIDCAHGPIAKLAKATVCKTVIRRFESGSGLTFCFAKSNPERAHLRESKGSRTGPSHRGSCINRSSGSFIQEQNQQQ